MKKPVAVLTAAFALAVILTGCSGGDSASAVSHECAVAMDAFGEVPAGDFDAEAIALTETTKTCTTADEYIAAVKKNPGAWLYKSASDVDEELLVIGACLHNADQPMCLDAKTKGLID